MAVYWVLIWSWMILLAAGFSPQDHEIFRLNDEISLAEGPGVTFYHFLGIKPSASQDDISKAYRRRSRVLHPDKIKQSLVAGKPIPEADLPKQTVKGESGAKLSPSDIARTVRVASQRYARLGVIANILKGSGRERYDFFLQNGFPAWKGTGYYYARFRPGLVTVLVGLFVFGGGFVHYISIFVARRRQKAFIQRYVDNARRMAWGDKMDSQIIPGISNAGTTSSEVDMAAGSGPMNRRQKRWQEKENKKEKKTSRYGPKEKSAVEREMANVDKGPQGERRRVQAENGKVLLVDAQGHVFLEEATENGESAEFLLDPEEVMPPKIQDTYIYRAPVWITEKLMSSFR